MKAANDNWPLVLTRPQAADMCRISVSTFDVWVRKGTLPGPIPGTRRWSRVAIERALSGGTASADPSQSPFEQWLIWSLEQQFGPAFTPELREAWIALYNAVRSEMIRAAQEAA